MASAFIIFKGKENDFTFWFGIYHFLSNFLCLFILFFSVSESRNAWWQFKETLILNLQFYPFAIHHNLTYKYKCSIMLPVPSYFICKSRQWGVSKWRNETTFPWSSTGVGLTVSQSNWAVVDTLGQLHPLDVWMAPHKHDEVARSWPSSSWILFLLLFCKIFLATWLPPTGILSIREIPPQVYDFIFLGRWGAEGSLKHAST